VVVSSGPVLVSSRAVVVTSGPVLVSSGAVVASSGAVVASSGAVVDSSGEVVVSSGPVLVSSGAVVASSGAVVASSGAAVVSSAVLVVSSAVVLVSFGAAVVSLIGSGGGRTPSYPSPSSDDTVLSESPSLLTLSRLSRRFSKFNKSSSVKKSSCSSTGPAESALPRLLPATSRPTTNHAATLTRLVGLSRPG